MATHNAFFYGTLMAPEVLYRVIYGKSDVSLDPSASAAAAKLTIKPAILHGHCRHRILDVDYPGMVPEAGHEVRGTYVAGLTDGNMDRLDIFEGGEYERKKVQLVLLRDTTIGGRIGDGKEGDQVVEAETYIFVNGDIEEGEWDYEVFRKEKMHMWADKSKEYQEVDNIPIDINGRDPTGGRGVQNSDGN